MINVTKETIVKQEEVNRATYSTPKALSIYSKLYIWPYETALFDKYLKPGMRVLDLGCGTGRSTKYIAERGVAVTGVDMVASFIEKGKAMYPELDLRVMNATKLDFPDASFDFVFFSNQGIDYSDEREKIRREAHRVLKPGGIFAYSSHNSITIPRTRRTARDFIKNIPRLRLGYHVRSEFHENGELQIGFNNIWGETRAIESDGFKVLEIWENRPRPSWPRILVGIFERWPMYIAQKK